MVGKHCAASASMQGAIDQAETPRPEPEPAPEEPADIPAPLPSGIGFAVVVPLRGPDERRPFLATMKDVLELNSGIDPGHMGAGRAGSGFFCGTQ